MKRLVVLNSFGPMASTLVSGLLEKSGFTNIPLRKLRLHQYLLGEYALDSGVMEDRLLKTLKNHSMQQLSGGVSVLDRNNQTPKALTDINRVRDQLSSLDRSSVKSLYYACRQAYSDAVIYKDIHSNPEWQIELTVDIHRFDSDRLYQSYKDSFDDVRMIHLHRPFGTWMNSLASQAFLNPVLKERIMFFPHLRYADYIQYEEAVANMPGLHIDFDDLFEKPIEDLSKTLSDFLEVPEPVGELREDSFDMYGKIRPFSVAFTKFDDKVVFLQKGTSAYINKQIKEGRIFKVQNAFWIWLLYLKDMAIFRSKNGYNFF